MKTLDRYSLSLTLASAFVLTGCPDDTVQNPFESGDTGTGTTSGTPDDGNDDVVTTVGVDDTTAGVADTGPVDSSTGVAVDTGSDGTTSTGGPGDGTSTSTGGGDGTTSSGGVGSSSSDGGMMGTACPAGTLDMLPTTISDSLVGEDHEFTGSCGGGGAPDLAFTLEAPSDGFYVFDTEGSAFDTILYVLGGDCGGAELACNDDTTGATSEVGVVLSQGDIVTVVVDSFGLAGGAFNLNATVFGGTCPDGDIGSAAPQTSMGDTLVSDNTFTGSCGGNLANDETLTFTASEAGIYTFDTLGSDYDTLLYVRQDCGGAELGCNNDISGVETASRVNVPMAQDETVVVVVDGNSEDGNYVLNVTLDECPDEALPSTVPQTVMGGTSSEVNSSIPSCSGGSTAPDYAYTYVAPVAGTYIIDTNGSTFDTVLYIIDGESCNGAVTLACNDDGGIGTQSQVVVNLAQDQLITIVVDGFSANSGNYVLNIDALGGACPDADLGNTVPATAMGDTTTSDDTIASSCGGLGAGDETFTFTAPQDGLYVVSTAGSAYTAQVSIFDSADCTGPELACADGGVGVALLQDQTVSIVVDGDSGAEGAFNVAVNLDVCPDGDLGSTVPQTVMGSTTGLSNSVVPTCGNGTNSEDFGYLFTAPATGMYTFDTNGTTHDTVLHITDGAVCGGPQLACDDDGGAGLQSLITIMLVQDQQVVVMVDGYNGADGPFTLNVN